MLPAIKEVNASAITIDSLFHYKHVTLNMRKEGLTLAGFLRELSTMEANSGHYRCSRGWKLTVGRILKFIFLEQTHLTLLVPVI